MFRFVKFYAMTVNEQTDRCVTSTAFFTGNRLDTHPVVLQVLTQGLHSFLLSGLVANYPLVLVGTPRHVQQAFQNVNTQLPGQALNNYTIHFYVPSKETVFKREQRAIMIVTTTPVTFMVCIFSVLCNTLTMSKTPAIALEQMWFIFSL